jgi:uncharacterized protein (TIGR02996 family)
MRPELLALLDAVRACPADDLRRLVLADWLDEHARTDADRGRADLIRVQLELLRRPASEPGRAALITRENVLVAAHAAEWGKGLPRGLADERTEGRGFTSVLGMLRPWFGRGQRWVNAVEPDHPAWAWVDGVTLLNVTGDDVAELTASPVLGRLNSLSVGPDGWYGWKGDVAIGHVAAELVGGSPHATALTHLNLSDCVIGPVGATALARSPHLRGLVYLDLGGWDCTPANLIRDAGARALADSPFLTRLEHLNLMECVITAAGVAALAESPNAAGLTHLYLSGNRLGAAGLRALADSPHLTRLVRLTAASGEYQLPPQTDAASADLDQARKHLRRRFGAVWDER